MNPTPSPGAVVMGGSAGSLEVLPFLLGPLPKDFALPIAVVIHTPKDRPSWLVQALTPHSRLTVREPEDKEPFEAGTVFVAAPGYHLSVERGPRFGYSIDPPVNYAQPSINVLFESAADVYGDRLVGVVLSGANDDGARGLASVHEVGGLALVQTPAEAKNPEMPNAALAACPTAEVLPVMRIAERLVSLAQARATK